MSWDRLSWLSTFRPVEGLLDDLVLKPGIEKKGKVLLKGNRLKGEPLGRMICSGDWLEEFVTELFNDWGGRRYEHSVPAEVTKTAPSGDRTTWSPTWSPTWSTSLPRIQLISPGSLSNMSPIGAIFVPSLPKTGTGLLYPRPPPPRSLNGSTARKKGRGGKGRQGHTHEGVSGRHKIGKEQQ